MKYIQPEYVCTIYRKWQKLRGLRADMKQDDILCNMKINNLSLMLEIIHWLIEINYIMSGMDIINHKKSQCLEIQNYYDSLVGSTK